MQARDILGYVSFGGNVGCNLKSSYYNNGNSRLVGFYDFKLGVSYTKKKNTLIMGYKLYNDNYIFIENYNLLGYGIKLNGLFIKWNYQLKNNFYFGAEISLLREAKQKFNVTENPKVYSICFGKKILNGRIGVEYRCDYFSNKDKGFNHINNFATIDVKI